MTWTLSISCLSSVVDYEENLFERFERNAPEQQEQLFNAFLNSSHHGDAFGLFSFGKYLFLME
jgi:hypothetical protein